MDYQIELRHIRYFLAVAEELHFKKAADRLFISQPGLSRQIQHVENELETPLFLRHNRKVELTPAGEFLYKNSSLWYASIQELLQRTTEIGSGIKATLRLGYVGSAMQEVIPSLLEKINSNYPDIKFTLDELDNSAQTSYLINNKIDIGFVRLSRAPSSLEMKTVLTEHFCLVLPQDHKLKRSELKSMKQLKSESFILFEKDYSPTYYEEIMSLFINAGFTPNVTHSSVNALTIFKMVENGFGLAVVPQSLKNTFNMRIKFIDLDHFPQRTNLNIIWKKSSVTPLIESVLGEF